MHTALMQSAHDLRGSLATLLLLVPQLGRAPHGTTDALKQMAEKKLSHLAEIADRLEALAHQLAVAAPTA